MTSRILSTQGFLLHGAGLAACALLMAGLATGPIKADGSGNQGNAAGPVISTANGPVRGFEKDGVSIFLGIPYAAPPVGDLRWRPPAPAEKWQGTLDATTFANTCPQVTELGAFAGPSSTTEDCLYLNVFTTSAKGTRKPVIVWLHGGGNVDGESNDYDASKLATGGPLGQETVVVTINYRMGLFGFLSNPALNAEGHLWGNYGILDQQAALHWVQRNIAAFGGDPTNVTMGGQSAGASDTTSNLLSPLAKGLFQRAILESGPSVSQPTAATALAAGVAFGEAANCPGAGSDAAACLRQLSTTRILQLQGTPNANGPFVVGEFVDGTIVPIQPAAAWATGQFNRMPILGGTVRDEANFGLGITEYFSGPPQVAMTPAQYLASVSSNVLAQYPLANFGNNAQLAFDRQSSDQRACISLRALQLLSVQVPTYGYEFIYQGAPYYFPKMPGFQPLAAHTIDIQFLFSGWHGGNLGVNLDQATGAPRELNVRETQLSDQLVAAWTKFAKSGNPNGSGNSPWPQLTASSPALLAENIPLSPYPSAQFSMDHKCDFWFPMLGL